MKDEKSTYSQGAQNKGIRQDQNCSRQGVSSGFFGKKVSQNSSDDKSYPRPNSLAYPVMVMLVFKPRLEPGYFFSGNGNERDKYRGADGTNRQSHVYSFVFIALELFHIISRHQYTNGHE